MSKQNKQIITILLLLFFTPVGLVLMFVWGLWTKTVRYVILGVCILLLILSFVIAGLLFAGGLFLLTSETKNQEATSQIYTTLETAKANAIEFTVTEFASYETKNNILNETGSYCALSYTVKNTDNNELALNAITDFDLTTDSGKSVGQFLAIGEEIVTRPEGLSNFLDTPGEVLDPGQEASYFYPFSCPDMESNYDLQVNINQYGKYLLDEEFEPIKFDLSL